MKDCAKTRTRKTVMPFHCRRPRGHDGRCSPYTLAPATNWTQFWTWWHSAAPDTTQEG